MEDFKSISFEARRSKFDFKLSESSTPSIVKYHLACDVELSKASIKAEIMPKKDFLSLSSFARRAVIQRALPSRLF